MLKTTVWGTPNKLKLTFTIKSKQRSTQACLPPPARWLRKAFSRAIFVNKISSFQIKWHRTLSQVFNKSWITGDPVMRADILLKQEPWSGLSMLNQKHFSRDAQGFVLTNKEILSVGLFSVLSHKSKVRQQEAAAPGRG